MNEQTPQQEMTHEDWTRTEAARLFNLTWELLGKNRTEAESRRMLDAAHASRALWGEVGDERNFAIGDWQISRVYSAISEPRLARFYAMSGLGVCTEARLGPFLTGYAMESIARASLADSKPDEAIYYLKAALDMLDLVSDPDEHKQLAVDLEDVRQQIERDRD